MPFTAVWHCGHVLVPELVEDVGSMDLLYNTYLMTVQEFEKLVAQALDNLPERFARAMDNVEVFVEVWPTYEELAAGGVGPGMTLFGLYRGIPKTQRGTYQAAAPDKIIVFAGPIVSTYGYDPNVIKDRVRDTVLHEIGHHFGMTDAEIRAAGK